MMRLTGPVAATLVVAVPALANAQPVWEHGYGHMWDGGFGLLGGLMMILFWGAIIVAAVLSRKPDAREIFRERLARGEIDPEAYEVRRKVLDS